MEDTLYIYFSAAWGDTIGFVILLPICTAYVTGSLELIDKIPALRGRIQAKLLRWFPFSDLSPPHHPNYLWFGATTE